MFFDQLTFPVFASKQRKSPSAPSAYKRPASQVGVAPFAPSEEELVALVHDIGPERVMFGSDFPWYDPGEMIKIVRSLPGFTDDELAGILGGNAARILGLPV